MLCCGVIEVVTVCRLVTINQDSKESTLPCDNEIEDRFMLVYLKSILGSRTWDYSLYLKGKEQNAL